MSATLTPPIELALRRRLRSKRKPRPCTCGTGCGVKDGFCAPYKAQLAVWREELESAGGWKNSDRLPCPTDGCWNHRVPPLPVCEDCAEEAA